jgi:phage terminase small subunit
MIDAGYSVSTAHERAKQTIGKNRIQKAISEIMEEQGLTDDRLLDVMDDGYSEKTAS